MKRRQKPIYSALRNLAISGPQPEGTLAPALPEPISGKGVSPHDPEGPGTIPVSTGTSDAVAAPAPTAASASEAETTAPARPSTGPVMRLSRASYDFGEVLVGNWLDWVLSLHNEGDREGIISEVGGLPSGGFSLADLPTLPRIIPPHESQALTAKFAPGRAGRESAQLCITTNDPGLPRQMVRLTGSGQAASQSLAHNSSGIITNSLGMSFRYIPAGTFWMGSAEHEAGRNDDEMPHEVTLTRDVYLQTTPVTQGQWLTLMGNNPSGFQNLGPDCPVEQVSWYDCQEFINRLNALGEGIYRLPTEAEWEYAARAGSTAAFALGDITTLFCDHDPISRVEVGRGGQ